MRPFAHSRDLACGVAVMVAASAATVATAQTEAEALPKLGPPAATPDGAPPGMATIEREGLRKHAYWLADDARNGRQTASTGQLETVDYVVQHFRELGLKPLGDKRRFVQKYPIERLELSKSTGLRFGKANLTDGFAVLHADPKDKVAASGKLAYCGNGNNIEGSLKGKIPVILVSAGATRGGVGGDFQALQRYTAISKRLAKTSAKAGIVCLLDDQGSLANALNYRALMRDHGVMAYGKFDRPIVKLPLMVLGTKASTQLLNYMGVKISADGGKASAGDGKAKGKLTIQVKAQRKATASNVCAVLEGTSKKGEAIVISAHHDHVGTRVDGDRFNGADDNASGTAGLLELAEAFAKCQQRPARSIVFLSVSGEELGLWGSAWYADHPTWPKSRIVANINIDMIGRAGRSDQEIQMQITPSHGHGKYSSIVRDAVALGKKFGIAFTSGDTYYKRSDHYNFAKKGIPVVFFCDGEHPDYHKVTDHADKLDYEAMEAIARLAYWTAWNTADAKQRPKELGKQSGW